MVWEMQRVGRGCQLEGRSLRFPLDVYQTACTARNFGRCQRIELYCIGNLAFRGRFGYKGLVDVCMYCTSLKHEDEIADGDIYNK
jgi:hypothetical protein